MSDTKKEPAENTRFEHDPEAPFATTGMFRHPAARVYAYAANGFVRAMKTVMYGFAHPFEDVVMPMAGQARDPAMTQVIDVTGADCHPGYIVDNKGQVAPPGLHTEPLSMDEPAYRDLSQVVPAPPTAQHADAMMRPPLMQSGGGAPPVMTDAKVESQPKDKPAAVPEGHKSGVQERLP